MTKHQVTQTAKMFAPCSVICPDATLALRGSLRVYSKVSLVSAPRSARARFFGSVDFGPSCWRKGTGLARPLMYWRYTL